MNDKTNCMTHTEKKEIKACLKENMEVEWSHGYSSALVHPCGKEGKCDVEWGDLVGRTGRSWDTRDEKKKSVSYWRLEKEDGKYCFFDSAVGKACG